MPRKKTKGDVKRAMMAERQLILRYQDKYQMLLKKGFDHDKAVARLIKGFKMNSLDKLKQRIMTARMRVGVSGVSLDGIRMTEQVKKYIKKLVELDVVQPYHKGQQSLKLVKPKVWRY